VAEDFYTTMAQVLPVLLLALIWDSAYLEKLRSQRRVSRRVDPSGVRFWTMRRVRIYILFVAATVIFSIALVMLELARAIPDSVALRSLLVCGLLITLATVLTRIYFDVIAATVEAPNNQDPGKP
jgi:uncharacterized BrkB/YihY/UPF0761 family membrane protein